MDELEIQSKKYISSKRASELTGYAKDYVGQLARSGKIAATRVGRAWYVEAQALLAHKENEAPIEAPKTFQTAPVGPVQSPLQPISRFQALQYGKIRLPDTWDSIRYFPDDSPLIPVPAKDPEILAENSQKPALQTPRTPPSMESDALRIKVLRQKTIQPFDIQKKNPEILKKARKIKSKRKNTDAALSFAALAAALGIFLFFSAGFFISSDVALTGANGEYTANSLGSFHDTSEFLNQLPAIGDGLQALGSFFTLIANSFSAFLRQGFDFLVSVLSVFSAR